MATAKTPRWEITQPSSRGYYYKLRFPGSEYWACDGEMLTEDEIRGLINALENVLSS